MRGGIINLVAPIVVIYVAIEGAIVLQNVLNATLITGWWGIGLVLAGIVGFVTAGKQASQQAGGGPPK